MRNRERRLNNKPSLTTEPIKIKRKYQKHMMENRVKFEILCFLVTLIEFRNLQSTFVSGGAYQTH